MVLVDLLGLTSCPAGVSLPQALTIPAMSLGGVLCTLDNDPDGAGIVAMSLSENGSTADVNMIPTGGDGLAGTTGLDQPAVGNLFGANFVVVDNNVCQSGRLEVTVLR